MTMRGVSFDVLHREERERRAFATVATAGRGALSGADLVLPERMFDRLLGAEPGACDPLEQMFYWARPLESARVLDICCFDGENGVVLARGGAHVTSIDLCEELVAVTRRRAAANGVADWMNALTMSVHDLHFPDESFDIVFGKASLHHLDLEIARREIFRVLRPGGVGIFCEPISLTPWLAAARQMVPVAPDRDSPDERQLTAADLARFTSGAETEFAYFRLLGRLARLFPSLVGGLKRADRRLLDHLPSFHRYAGVCVFRVRKAREPRLPKSDEDAP
jgi:SAM-dependent methyltransferase